MNNDALTLDLSLAFPSAGVSFDIQVRQYGAGGNPTSFRLTVSALSDGRPVPLRSDASPQLADWVRGYTRWLHRAQVSGAHDETGILGVFPAGLSAEQVLRNVHDACDMIRQRFAHYQESVLV